ncbi:MAG TPA: hypothetical protein VGL81_27685 [Polyangiaceae bacterium]|jgi:hypothetical protein
MRGVWLLGCGAAAVVAATLFGCNGLLGIGAASMESEDGGTDGAPVVPTRALSCAYYCATIVTNCTQANAEFVGSEDSQTLCNTMCPAFDTGSAIGPSNDNTLACRIYYAEQAQSDPTTNCRFAGVGGGGKCGTDPCSTFCALDTQYCNTAAISTPDSYPFASTTDCQTACTGSPDAGADSGGFPYLTTGQDLLDDTNTLNCRLWHLENAYGSTANGKFHCPHTQQVSSMCF